MSWRVVLDCPICRDPLYEGIATSENPSIPCYAAIPSATAFFGRRPDDQEDKKFSIDLNQKNYATSKELVIDGQQRLTALVFLS